MVARAPSYVPDSSRLVAVGAAVLAAPFRAVLWLIELLIREGLAPLLALPILLAIEVQF